MSVLIIEDQTDVADFLKKGLTAEHYKTAVAYDGEDGLHKALNKHYDFIILDLMLPIINGIDVCKRLRGAGISSLIIMLTAKDAVKDKITGLNAGADDYLVKPFSLEELIARMKALQRRTYPQTKEVLSAGTIRLDPDRHEVAKAGKVVELSATEFKLLKYLLENKNIVISKSKILENVWEYHFDPKTNIVDVYINFLRTKLDKKSKIIKTVYGVGFKLCS